MGARRFDLPSVYCTFLNLIQDYQPIATSQRYHINRMIDACAFGNMEDYD